MDGATKQEIIKEAEEMLRPVLLSGEGVWIIDYVRIRLRAQGGLSPGAKEPRGSGQI